MGIIQATIGLFDHDAKKRLGKRRSSQWSSIRAAHLQCFSTCAACGRKDKLNVHHVEPFHLRPELELTGTNLITLCEYKTCNCHLFIGHCGRWDAYNPSVREDAELFLRMLSRRKVA